MKRKIAVLLSVLMVMSCIAGPALAVETGLDEATKQEYYNEYVEIAKEISEETGVKISVHPISDFTEEDWLAPEDYRQLITEVATCELRPSGNPVKLDNVPTPESLGVSATYEEEFEAGGSSHTIAITGVFTTYYDTFHNRQLFEGYQSITSKLVTGFGSWKQRDYEVSLTDSRRVYTFIVSGTFTLASTDVDKIFTVGFYCEPDGAVSVMDDE